MCYKLMCSEWTLSQAASEGGGGKGWARQKSGDDEEEEERSKIASPCKNVYLIVVPVHCLPHDVFSHLCVVMC